eukprot:scaffold7471_cov430-Prasinococcus_capsulatus_cf.AAC.4
MESDLEAVIKVYLPPCCWHGFAPADDSNHVNGTGNLTAGYQLHSVRWRHQELHADDTARPQGVPRTVDNSPRHEAKQPAYSPHGRIATGGLRPGAHLWQSQAQLHQPGVRPLVPRSGAFVWVQGVWTERGLLGCWMRPRGAGPAEAALPRTE